MRWMISIRKNGKLPHLMMALWQGPKPPGSQPGRSWEPPAKENIMEDFKMSTVNAIIASFGPFNQRRYGTPWVCAMTPAGGFDFSKSVGTYTGNGYQGEEGDLVVTNPVVGQVYGYGQKVYRGSNTEKKFAKWTGEKFVPCDKVGRVKEG